MNYLLAIKTAVVIFPLLALIITGPFILHQYHKFASIEPLKTILIYSFIFYLLCAYFLVILPLPKLEDVINNPDWMIQTIPFHFIIDFLKETPLVLSSPKTYIQAIMHPSFYVVFFNILLFIPFGMFLKYYKHFSVKKVFKYSLLLSAFFEFTQLTRLYGIYPKPYRLCDIDDILLNTLGGVVGYLWMLDLEKRLPKKEELEILAYKKGENVSPLRRTTLFFLDLFLYITFTILAKGFHPILIFIIYFTVIPFFYHHKTLGSSFLNIKITKTKNTILYYLRPYFIYCYYLLLPYGIFYIATIIGHYISSSSVAIIFYLSIVIMVFLFYLINMFLLFIHKSRFYDTLFSTKLESTIKEKIAN